MSFSLTFANGEKKIYKDGEFFKLTNLEEEELCCLVGFEDPDSKMYPIMGKIFGLYRFSDLKQEKEYIRKYVRDENGNQPKVIFAPVTFRRYDENGRRYEE